VADGATRGIQDVAPAPPDRPAGLGLRGIRPPMDRCGPTSEFGKRAQPSRSNMEALTRARLAGHGRYRKSASGA